MADADDKNIGTISDVFGRIAGGFARTGTVRSTIHEALDHSHDRVEVNVREMLSKLKLEPEAWLVEPTEEVLEAASKRGSETMIISARALLDSSVIVFTHAIVDDAICSMLEISARHDPKAWAARFDKRKIEVGDVTRDPETAILEFAIAQSIDRRKCPMPENLKLLLGFFKPELKRDNLNEPNFFVYDDARLDSFHENRRRIVHEQPLDNEDENWPTEHSWLRILMMRMVIMMCSTYSLQIIPSEAFPPQTCEDKKPPKD
ncbi:MAG: hypothetical protein IH945_01095 [Armatimonadetes bacterium]|nr:hypothetical protein [Armatimonadota bacterium]